MRVGSLVLLGLLTFFLTFLLTQIGFSKVIIVMNMIAELLCDRECFFLKVFWIFFGFFFLKVFFNFFLIFFGFFFNTIYSSCIFFFILKVIQFSQTCIGLYSVSGHKQKMRTIKTQSCSSAHISSIMMRCGLFIFILLLLLFMLKYIYTLIQSAFIIGRTKFVASHDYLVEKSLDQN